jgi:predicted nucleotidyltransferase
LRGGGFVTRAFPKYLENHPEGLGLAVSDADLETVFSYGRVEAGSGLLVSELPDWGNTEENFAAESVAVALNVELGASDEETQIVLNLSHNKHKTTSDFPKIKKYLDDFISAASEGLGDELVAVILFGSYAYGKPTKRSDMDVCAVIRSFKRLSKRDAQRAVFRHCGSFLNIDIDFVMTDVEKLMTADESFISGTIREKGVVLYEKA